MNDKNNILGRANALFLELDSLPLTECVDMINALRIQLSKHSPFSNEPVDCIQWIQVNRIKSNDYNPNEVAPPEMRLLKLSINTDGYTQPIVACGMNENYIIVDGFHRLKIGKKKDIYKKLHGYLPVALIRKNREEEKHRIASTIRHNRARGVHCVFPMKDVVVSLLRYGWLESDIAYELGMDVDEVLRFKQASGLPELFSNASYSQSWE